MILLLAVAVYLIVGVFVIRWCVKQEEPPSLLLAFYAVFVWPVVGLVFLVVPGADGNPSLVSRFLRKMFGMER